MHSFQAFIDIPSRRLGARHLWGWNYPGPEQWSFVWVFPKKNCCVTLGCNLVYLRKSVSLR